jgi:citrate synthase
MSSGTLFIKDSRSGKQYELPIRRNTVLARDFKQIKVSAVGANRADRVTDGLRVHDPGLENTTVVETSITYAYGCLSN